ncbi:MAG: lipopolysaccharide core heptose(II) kinase RfaY [Cetobacterium sp.]|uniref:lipopolysaccharide core heptose(II) kinase RfaY n=1 Tax=Cetobacterium sp. TaxID=2071632 RepID=UPI002FC79241
MLKKIDYKGYNLYFYDEKYEEIGKYIIEKKYKVLKYIKDTKRNFVVLVDIKGKKYIYKEPRNEFRIPQRQIMTIFKKGEALTTLENIEKLIKQNNREDFAKVYLAINKRKNGVIVESSFLMEYFDGVANYDFINKEVEILKEIHNLGIYHGDFNPGNFLVSKKGEIKIIDTQGKKMIFGRFRAHYDMLTMKLDSYPEMIYPYKRDIWYFMALEMKKIKRLKFIEEIKKYKKNLRDKGWKI